MRKLLLGLAFVGLLFAAPVVCDQHIPASASIRPLWAAAVDPNADNEQGAESRAICTVNSINSQIGLWLTAAHCLDGAVLVAQPQADGTTVLHAAKVMALDKKFDLGILYTHTLKVTNLHLAPQSPSAGDSVHVLGFPLGLPVLQWFKGYVSSLVTPLPEQDGSMTDYMLYGMTVCGGNSGSVVLNDKDEVISVLQIGFGRPCSSFSGGVPYETLVAFTKGLWEQN